MFDDIRQNWIQKYGIYQVKKCGFWFVDIPRTSSSSIRIELGNQFGSAYGKLNLIEKQYAKKHIFEDHIPSIKMQEKLGESIWEKLFTFSIVRNPWDRLVSHFLYRKRCNHFPDDWTFKNYVLELSENGVNSKYFRFYGHTYTMCDFLMDENDKMLVDFIGRFENRENDLKVIASRINCESLGKIFAQSSGKKNSDYRDFYDSESKQIVGKYFEKDLDYFKYGF